MKHDNLQLRKSNPFFKSNNSDQRLKILFYHVDNTFSGVVMSIFSQYEKGDLFRIGQFLNRKV